MTENEYPDAEGRAVLRENTLRAALVKYGARHTSECPATIIGPDPRCVCGLSGRAASATDDPREQAQLGICPVCQNLFRTDGHAYDCPLAASATDERPLLHDCAHCRNVRKLAASATERRCGVRATPCRFDRADWCVVHRSYAALAAPATDEPTRLDVALDSYGAGWSDAARRAASATKEEWTAEDERRARLREQRRAASATDENDEPPSEAEQHHNRVYGRLAASATDENTLRAAQREVVREWFDEGHETGRMEYDVLLDRLAASATDEGRRGLERLADFDKGYDAGLAASATDDEKTAE